MSNEDHDNDTCPNYATATRWMSAHGYCVTENKRLLAENADLKDRLDKAENQVEDLEIENARLKAEVERLRNGVETMTWNVSGVVTTQWVRAVEYDRLKAEVERLNAECDGLIKGAESDVAYYKAEVERLTAFTTRTIIPNEELQAQVERVGAENAHLHKGIYSLSLNVAQLKDEVERLTKAGDGVLNSLDLCYMGKKLHLLPSVIAWNAAKEGKPSNG